MSELFQIIEGDSLYELSLMADNSVDSIVTDPPYGFGFMGKHWDYSVPGVDVWKECLRVLKPGGFMLCFGGSRTYHRVVVNIEDAGFEIRDQIMWLYGSGFPKSKNLKGENEGLGTGLKPAHEPIVLARKSPDGTVEINYRKYGTGVLNIAESRVEFYSEDDKQSANWGRGTNIKGGNLVGATEGNGKTNIPANSLGRWPANVIHDGSDEVMEYFPDAAGQAAYVGPEYGDKNSVNTYGNFKARKATTPRNDKGSAGRFFYCAKASKKDREEGLEHLPKKVSGMVSNTSGQHITRREADYKKPLRVNDHPTVKPTALMRYLVKLITPKGGKVLDPFAGSGSTGKGAILEGFFPVLIEREPSYIPIINGRVEYAVSQMKLKDAV